MGFALTIAVLDLKRRLRDRSLLIQGIIAPVVLAVVVSVAFANGAALDFSIAVVDSDASATSNQVVQDVQAASGDNLEIVGPISLDEATRRIDDEELDAAIVINPDFEVSLHRGQRPEFTVLVDPARSIGGDIAEAIAEGIAGRIDGARLAAAAVPDDPQAANEAAANTEAPINTTEASVTTDYDIGTYFAPSMAILFLFLTLGSGSRSLLTERKEGTLTRLRSTSVSPRDIVAGKTLSVLALGLASFVTVYVITSLFGSDWGSPIAVVAVIAATTGAVAALSTMVTGLAKSDAQAEGYTSALTFGLALLGGNFVTPDSAPELLRQLGRLTPNGWALESFTDLSAGDAGLTDIVPALAVLLAITIVAGTVGLGLVTKQVRT